MRKPRAASSGQAFGRREQSEDSGAAGLSQRSAGLAAVALALVFGFGLHRAARLSPAEAGSATAGNVCAMHHEIVSSSPASCSRCGMPLVAIAHYTCPMHPSVASRTAGACPHCRMPLEVVTEGELASGEVRVAVWVGMIALAGLDAETGVVMLLYLKLAVK